MPLLAAAGWSDAVIEPLAGDASFRRYFRLRRARKTAMLMDAPPPNEDPQPFLRAAKRLDANGLRAAYPGRGCAAGWVLPWKTLAKCGCAGICRTSASG
ncbi:MAG: hypothetical protein R3E03_02015 [Novosphingobium sp.]